MFEDGPKAVPVYCEEALDGVRGFLTPAGLEGTNGPWLSNR
jgi:hypothetical protein